VTDFSTVIAAAGLLLAIITFYLGRQSGVKTDAREMGTILTELQNIKSGVDEIKQHQATQDANNMRVAERLAILETSVKRLERASGGDNAAT